MEALSFRPPAFLMICVDREFSLGRGGHHHQQCNSLFVMHLVALFRCLSREAKKQENRKARYNARRPKVHPPLGGQKTNPGRVRMVCTNVVFMSCVAPASFFVAGLYHNQMQVVNPDREVVIWELNGQIRPASRTPAWNRG